MFFILVNSIPNSNVNIAIRGVKPGKPPWLSRGCLILRIYEVSLVTPKEERDMYEDALKGRTMQVYFYMLKINRPISAREIQRSLNLSSPSLSLHHLGKLKDIGLVTTNTDGEYVICKHVDSGLLHFFIGKGFLLVPRFLLYSVLRDLSK